MLLSIIVPIYNQERYLTRCLDSIYNQGLREDDFELLLINDGSTDRSMDIMLSYANNHSNIRIISKENEGVSATRNRGIKEAKGKYIYMPDSDDYLIANGLSYVINNFLNDDIDVLMFYSQTVLPEKLHTIPQDISGQIVYDGYGRDFIKHNFNFAVWNLIIKTDFLKCGRIKDDKWFDERTTMEDTLFNINIAIQNPRYRVVNSNIYRYIINPSSEITSRNPKKIAQHIYSYQIILEELQCKINNEDDIDIKTRIKNVTYGIYRPFTSRLLLSDLSFVEIENVITNLRDKNIISPSNNLIKLFFNYPILFLPARVIYKYIFDPFILPIIKRNYA